MTRLFPGLIAVSLFGAGLKPPTYTTAAWPHRAILTSLDERPVAFRAYTRGGVLIIAVDASGRLTTTPSGTPRVRALTTRDTIRASTPANFPLDLSKGPVVFFAEGRERLRLVVGRNPNGQLDQVSATGRRFTVKLEGREFVIEAR